MSSIAPPNPAFPRGSDRNSRKEPKAKTKRTHRLHQITWQGVEVGGTCPERQKASTSHQEHIARIVFNNYTISLASKEIRIKSLATKKYILWYIIENLGLYNLQFHLQHCRILQLLFAIQARTTKKNTDV